MNIAEMRMLGRKINEQNVAKAKAQVEVAPVSVSSNVPVAPVVVAPVKAEEDLGWGKYVAPVEPVREPVRESASYVIIDEVPAAEVKEEVPVAKEKKQRRTVSSILGRIVSKKDVVTETPVAPVDQEVKVPQLTREELIKSVEAAIAKQDVLPPRIMKCTGCKDDFKVTPEMEMFKTRRCPKCMEAAKSKPVVVGSAYGMKIEPSATATIVKEEVKVEAIVETTVEATVEAAVATEVPVPELVKATKKKGLRAGGKKTSTADLGLDLSEAQ